MQVEFKPSALREISWYEYALRFLFGGLVTVAAGIIARKYGPGIGGLFLGFPAIFPAAATLVEKHEREKKHDAGLHGSTRGREAASLEAAGAAKGCVALLGFALVAWWLLPDYKAPVALGLSVLVWAALVAILWWTRRVSQRLRRKRGRHR